MNGCYNRKSKSIGQMLSYTYMKRGVGVVCRHIRSVISDGGIEYDNDLIYVLELLFGELGCNASGSTEKTAAARLLRLDAGDWVRMSLLWREDRLSSESEMTLQSSLAS